MPFLLGGFAILCGLLLLGYLFVNAEPARLARTLKWLGLGLAAVVVVVLALSGRLIFFTPLIALLPALYRMRSRFSGFRGPAAGQTSDVVTPFIRMRLDHDTGDMNGTILQGDFAGMRIDELSRSQLLGLLRECRAADEDGARLVEAYLDRMQPGWRDDFHGEQGASSAPPASSDVSVEEAYAILGLAPGADAAAVQAAHHRLMKQLHPDHGGTDYLATKINRARDVLLHK